MGVASFVCSVWLDLALSHTCTHIACRMNARKKTHKQVATKISELIAAQYLPGFIVSFFSNQKTVSQPDTQILSLGCVMGPSFQYTHEFVLFMLAPAWMTAFLGVVILPVLSLVRRNQAAKTAELENRKDFDARRAAKMRAYGGIHDRDFEDSIARNQPKEKYRHTMSQVASRAPSLYPFWGRRNS